MGIYDREYYRSGGSSFLGSFAEQGKACKWLIGINVVLFVAQLAVPSVTSWLDLRTGQAPALSRQDEMIRQFDPRQIQQLAPEDQEWVKERRQQIENEERPGVLQGQVWRLLTYAFLHSVGGMPWHIIFNMLFLWWFGHEMEEMYGPREFTIFYLVAALLGGLAYFAWSVLRDNPIPCVGASGAVLAVMVLYACHYPRRLIYVMFVLPIPIWLFVGGYLAWNALQFVGNMPTETAVTVHLAGGAFGFCYYKWNWRLAPLWTAVTRLRLPRRRPRLSVYEEDEPPTPVRRSRPAPAAPTGVAAAAPQAASDEHLEAQVDAVLEKVARSGRDSLTESEKALLVRASEVYKRKQRS